MTTTDLEPAAWMYGAECEEPFASMKRWPSGVVEAQCWTETALYTADQIKALIEERDRLREALAALIRDWEQNDASDNDEWSDGYEDALADVARKARAALAGEKP